MLGAHGLRSLKDERSCLLLLELIGVQHFLDGRYLGKAGRGGAGTRPSRYASGKCPLDRRLFSEIRMTVR